MRTRLFFDDREPDAVGARHNPPIKTTGRSGYSVILSEAKDLCTWLATLRLRQLPRFRILP